MKRSQSGLFLRAALVFALFPFLLLIASCAPAARPVYFLSDRHGLSYEIVRDYCERERCATLVLFDWHNDVGPASAAVHSYDWVGQLVDAGTVSEVCWVCRRSASGLELSDRRSWLERNAAGRPQDAADKMLRSFRIVDFDGLQELRLEKPFVATVDLDLYGGESALGRGGGDADGFIRDTCAFLRRTGCPLVTVSLSAAYQQSPGEAWGYLDCFMRNVPARVEWLFASGASGEKEESLEDRAAFARWKEDVARFQTYQRGFYRGAALWLGAPPAIRELFAKKKLMPFGGDAGVSAVTLRAMARQTALEGQFLSEAGAESCGGWLSSLHGAAVDELRASLAGDRICPPPECRCPFTDGRSRGIAVRYRSAGSDRGCLALYSGLDFSAGDAEAAARYASAEAARDPRYRWIVPEELDGLFINISLFGRWEPMASCLDFVPGLDSLLLVNQQAENAAARETLLQASLALERGYTREEFLRRLSVKAGLGADGYKDSSLRFYKAATLSYTAPAIAGGQQP